MPNIGDSNEEVGGGNTRQLARLRRLGKNINMGNCWKLHDWANKCKAGREKVGVGGMEVIGSGLGVKVHHAAFSPKPLPMIWQVDSLELSWGSKIASSHH